VVLEHHLPLTSRGANRGMLTTLAVENYRSLRRLVLPLDRLNVVTGANGSGKSNLYRALRLLADASRNGAVAALAREGGLPSTLWAGPEHVRHDRPTQGTVRSKPVALRLGFAGDDLGYAIDLGLPVPSRTAFTLDPEIKRESIWRGRVLRTSTLLADRHGGVVRTRRAGGSWSDAVHKIRPFDSMLTEVAEPEVLLVRERVRSWRFYDHFRTDAGAPARRSHVGTRTPVLAADGADLAAALQTIREIGDVGALESAIDGAFPGSRVEVTDRFDLLLRQPGLLRPLGVAELSDGTLRYLLWVAALLTPRPPELLVLNEPETSLHPDLLPPLAGLVASAATRTQVVAVSHSRPLIAALAASTEELHTDELNTVELYKDLGRTLVRDQEPLDEPPWKWAPR
jgi:predicted ATPase